VVVVDVEVGLGIFVVKNAVDLLTDRAVQYVGYVDACTEKLIDTFVPVWVHSIHNCPLYPSPETEKMETRKR
jgi:hypothetical protein